MEWTDPLFDDPLWGELHETMFSATETELQLDRLLAVLKLDPGARVLDAPCGPARVAIPLAKRGFQVTGLDRSRPLLSRGRALAAAADVEISFIEGDLRELPVGADFDVILNLWGSFGYFDDAGNRRFLERSLDSLKPGGRLLIDAPTTEQLYPNFVARTWARKSRLLFIEERNYDPLTGENRGAFTFVHDDGRRATMPFAIRVYGLAELRALLLDVGFSDVQASASYGTEPMSIGKRPLVIATR